MQNRISESLDLGYDVLEKCPDEPDARGEALSNLAFPLQRGYNHFLSFKVSHESRHLMKGQLLLDESLDLITRSMTIGSEKQLSKLENVLTYVLYIKEFPRDIQVAVLAKCFLMLRAQVELMEQIAILSNVDDRPKESSANLRRHFAPSQHLNLARIQVHDFKFLRLI